MGKFSTVCVDFNGVLDMYSGWVQNGVGTEYEPRPGAKEFLKGLKESFDTVVVCSVISPRLVLAWLVKHGLNEYVDKVTDRKPIANVYIDDRAVCFDGDFEKALEQARNFSPHWIKG